VILGQDSYPLPDVLHDIMFQFDSEYDDIFELDIRPKTNQSLAWNPIFYNEVVNKGVFYGRP